MKNCFTPVWVSLFAVFGLLVPKVVDAQNLAANPAHTHLKLEAPGKGQFVFVRNDGQWNKQVQYRASIPQGTMFLTKKGFVYSYYNPADLEKVHGKLDNGDTTLGTTPIHQYAYKVNFVGADVTHTTFAGLQKRSNYVNFFIGNDRSKWAGGVPIFKKVKQSNVYPGIDLLVYSKHYAPKYDFIVAPDANPNQIVLQFEGVNPELNNKGDIIIKTSLNKVEESAPVAYQMINGTKVNVPVKYKLRHHKLSFVFLQGYDHNYQLIIDPQLVFCTYSGSNGGFGSGYFSYSTTFDYNGCGIPAGSAWNSGWPTTTGAFQSNFASTQDVCINKYNPTGTNLLFSTYFGGNSVDHPHAPRVNAQNELYIVGSTQSSNLPTTTGAYDSVHSGSWDMFVAHFSYDGTQLLGSTYIGGSSNEPCEFDGISNSFPASSTGDQYATSPVDIQFDPSGNAWIVGNTSSNNFPTTANAEQATYGGGNTDGVLFELDPTCSNLMYSSYLGGTAADGLNAIQFNSAGNLVVGGFTCSSNYPTTTGAFHESFVGGSKDGVVTIINPVNGSIINSTFVGTLANDWVIQLQVDDSNDVYLMGQCSNNTYPVHNANYSITGGNTFIDELTPDLDTSIASTIVGSTSTSQPFALSGYKPDGFLLDNCGNVYVTGMGAPSGLPTSNDALVSNGGSTAPFWFCVLKPHFTGLLYASYFGVTNDHTHCGINRLSPEGVVYHSICNNSTFYPYTTPGAWATTKPSSGQDIVTFKFDFQATGVAAHIQLPINGNDSACGIPYTLHLDNLSTSPYPMTFQWSAGDGSGITTDSNFTHTYTDTGTYMITLHAHSDSACITDNTDTFYFTLVDIAPPDLTVSPDTLICDTTTTLNLWVVIHNPDSNDFIDWSPVTGILTGNNQDSILVQPTTTSYYVTVRDSIPGLCTVVSKDTVDIGFYPRGVNIISNDTTVCKGAAVPIMAESLPGYVFNWSPGGSMNDSTLLTPVITANQTETYTLTAHHPGCTDTAQTIKITVQDQPTVDLGDNIDICAGGQVALTANVSPYRDDYIYQWTPTAGLANPNEVNTHFRAQSSGWYYLNVSTPIGCSGEDSVYVTVFAANFGAVSPDTGYCPPANPVQLWAANGVKYHWTPSEGLSNDTIANPLANPTSTTDYTVYMEDNHGCEDTGRVRVSVYAGAVLNMPDSVTIYPGETYHLTPATNCVHFQWFPTNGVNSVQVSDPVFSPAVRTRYFVTARTINGCPITDSIDILVDGTLINMPNAFAPGTGGANNTFKVSKRGIARLITFDVYNRWGNQVFSTTDIDKGWDGTFEGKPQAVGVYVYYVKAVTDAGKVVVKQGNVTLLR